MFDPAATCQVLSLETDPISCAMKEYSFIESGLALIDDAARIDTGKYFAGPAF
jgi:hypothetical protein